MQQDFIDKLAESPAKLIPVCFATVIACGICVWIISFALEAQAKSLDKKIIAHKDISGVGNSKRQLRCFMLDDNSFYFMTGCFSGNEKELKKRVLEKYGKDCEYMEAIKCLKKLCKNYKL